MNDRYQALEVEKSRKWLAAADMLERGAMDGSRRRRWHSAAARLAGPLKKNAWLRRSIYRLLCSNDYNAAPANMKKTLRNLLASDERLPSRLAEIKAPVSIIWGEADRVTPLAQADELHRRLGDVCRFEVIAGAGHAPCVGCPRRLEAPLVKVLETI